MKNAHIIAIAAMLCFGALALSQSTVLTESRIFGGPLQGPADVQGPGACLTVANSAAIAIPATGSSGAAAPYPSNVTVSGLGGTVTKVTVKLNGLAHSWPADVEVLLVGPAGQNAILMSDVGGGNPITGVTLTLDDAAAAFLPGSALTTGTFRPTNVDVGDAFPAPSANSGGRFGIFGV